VSTIFHLNPNLSLFNHSVIGSQGGDWHWLTAATFHTQTLILFFFPDLRIKHKRNIKNSWTTSWTQKFPGTAKSQNHQAHFRFSPTTQTTIIFGNPQTHINHAKFSQTELKPNHNHVQKLKRIARKKKANTNRFKAVSTPLKSERKPQEQSRSDSIEKVVVRILFRPFLSTNIFEHKTSYLESLRTYFENLSPDLSSTWKRNLKCVFTFENGDVWCLRCGGASLLGR